MGIDSGSILIQLLKPSSFTPVLGMAGIILYPPTEESMAVAQVPMFCPIMMGMAAP